jgi:predicted HAD superfamily phosphohydrolase
MVEYQLKAFQLNPGVEDLMKFITREKDEKPYFATNAYPAAALKTAESYQIPLHNVRTQGLQDFHGVNYSAFLIDTCARRVPMEFFIKKRKEVKKFLDDWIYAAQRMLPAAKARNVNGVTELMLEYMHVFHRVADRELRALLKEMFIPPYETAIMGGQNKKRVVDEVADETGKKTVSFGDSIVDADMLGGASVGVSINCTNRHAVDMSSMNVCVVDYELLIPMIGDMISDRFDLSRVKEYETDGLKIFAKDEIMKAVVDEQAWKNSEIRAANNATKSELKKLFKKPSYA